jgi:hypothetical protein
VLSARKQSGLTSFVGISSSQIPNWPVPHLINYNRTCHGVSNEPHQYVDLL